MSYTSENNKYIQHGSFYVLLGGRGCYTETYKILTCVGLHETFTQRPCLFWRHEQLCFSKSISVQSCSVAQFIQRSLCDVKPANIRKLLKGTHLQTVTVDKQFLQLGCVYFKKYLVKMKQPTMYVYMYACMHVLPISVCKYVLSYGDMQACMNVSHSETLHSAYRIYLFFVRFPPQGQNIYPVITNRLVFVTRRECVYCPVRTESFRRT